MDSFFGIGVFELVFILIIALIVLGPERLPQAMRQVVGAIRQIRDLSSDITKQFSEEFGDLAELDPRRQIQQALNDPAEKPKKTTSTKPAITKPTTTKPTTTKAAVAKPKPATPSKTVATAKKTETAKSEPEKAGTTAVEKYAGTNTDDVQPVASAEPEVEGATEETTEKTAETAVARQSVAATATDEIEDAPARPPEQPDAEDHGVVSTATPKAGNENGTHSTAESNHSGAVDQEVTPEHPTIDELRIEEKHSIAPPHLGDSVPDEDTESDREPSPQHTAEEGRA